MKRIISYMIIGIVAILIITNPSITSFKSYLGKNSYLGLMRKSNYFIYSVYRDSSYDDENDIQHSDVYIGVVGNFWMGRRPVNLKSDTLLSKYVDTIGHTGDGLPILSTRK